MKQNIGFVALTAWLLTVSATTVGADSCGHFVMLPSDALLPGWERSAETEVPESYWGKSIRTLRPIRVIRDRVNIAVVVSEYSKEMAGFYFVIPESSHSPTNGPGRTFRCNTSNGLLGFVFLK